MKEKYVFIKIESTNRGENFLNLNVMDKERNHFNIKVEKDFPVAYEVGQIYWTSLREELDSLREKNLYYLEDIKNIFDLNYDIEGLENVLKCFFELKNSLVEQRKKIYGYIESIENPILRDITFYLIDKYKGKYFVYPAAAKFHHAHIGGIAGHTLGMLKLADSLYEIYPEMSKSLVYSGILLHDLMKVAEYDQVINPKMTREALLLGHISMVINEVDLAANMYKYEEEEEIFQLKHILLSHHGQYAYGSPKKPQTMEAFIVNYVDTLDSKVAMILEELGKTKEHEFTEAIGVVDRTEFYKHTIK